MSKLPRANKDLGQHFLKDPKVIEAITNDFASVCDVIIEVGPGPAILSHKLASHQKPFYILEEDPRFKEYLMSCVKEENMFWGDALQFNWQEFIQKEKLENKKIWLVSNLPYNISVPLFMSFLPIKEICYMSLMYQKEVGEKTYWKNDTKNQMNSLLANAINYFDTKLLYKVKPGAFHPPPKVDSVVVSYVRKTNAVISLAEFNEFEKFLRLVFGQKRKQLGSIVKNTPYFKALEVSKIDPTRRAETLLLEEIYTLFNAGKLHN